MCSVLTYYGSRKIWRQRGRRQWMLEVAFPPSIKLIYRTVSIAHRAANRFYEYNEKYGGVFNESLATNS